MLTSFGPCDTLDAYWGNSMQPPAGCGGCQTDGGCCQRPDEALTVTAPPIALGFDLASLRMPGSGSFASAASAAAGAAGLVATPARTAVSSAHKCNNIPATVQVLANLARSSGREHSGDTNAQAVRVAGVTAGVTPGCRDDTTICSHSSEGRPPQVETPARALLCIPGLSCDNAAAASVGGGHALCRKNGLINPVHLLMLRSLVAYTRFSDASSNTPSEPTAAAISAAQRPLGAAPIKAASICVSSPFAAATAEGVDTAAGVMRISRAVLVVSSTGSAAGCEGTGMPTVSAASQHRKRPPALRWCAGSRSDHVAQNSRPSCFRRADLDPPHRRRVSPDAADSATNEACPIAILHRLANDPDRLVRSEVASHPACSEAILRQLANDPDRLVRSEVASHPAAPVDLIASAAADDDASTRVGAAKNPSTPPQLIERLAGGDNVFVRKAAARNPSCPQPTLARLAADPAAHVRVGAARNPNCPPGLCQHLAEDPEAEVRKALMTDENRSPEIVALAVGDTDPGVRYNAAHNPGCPPQTLHDLSTDPDQKVRASTAKNLSCPLQTLRDMAADKDHQVRAAATTAIMDRSTRGVQAGSAAAAEALGRLTAADRSHTW